MPVLSISVHLESDKSREISKALPQMVTCRIRDACMQSVNACCGTRVESGEVRRTVRVLEG